jgi:hypothetical protein
MEAGEPALPALVARRILDRWAIGAPSVAAVGSSAMPKTETPKPPEHRTYPRGATAPQPPPPPKQVPLWTRAVPPDRSFPRS